jgi:hypothetical protein
MRHCRRPSLGLDCAVLHQLLDPLDGMFDPGADRRGHITRWGAFTNRKARDAVREGESDHEELPVRTIGDNVRGVTPGGKLEICLPYPDER